MYKLYNKYYTEKNNESTLKLTKDDNALYITQLLLPILNNNKLEGLFICFRTHMNYIDSSIKPIKATRNFVQKILNDNQQHK